MTTRDEHCEFPTDAGQPLCGLLRRVENGNRWVLVCRGLTGSVSRPSSLDDLVDALEQRGWSSLRFDYRGSLKPEGGEFSRTVGSMLADIAVSVSGLKDRTGRLPGAIIARGFGARLALEVLKPYADVPIVMWAPILWLKTSLEIRFRLHEWRRSGHLEVDKTTIGGAFIDSLKDASDAEIRSWIAPQRQHTIIHGEKDQVVPLRLAKEAEEVISAAGGRVALVTTPGKHPHPDEDVREQIAKIVSTVGFLA